MNLKRLSTKEIHDSKDKSVLWSTPFVRLSGKYSFQRPWLCGVVLSESSESKIVEVPIFFGEI